MITFYTYLTSITFKLCVKRRKIGGAKRKRRKEGEEVEGIGYKKRKNGGAETLPNNLIISLTYYS